MNKSGSYICHVHDSTISYTVYIYIYPLWTLFVDIFLNIKSELPTHKYSATMTSRHRPGEYTRSRLYDPGYDTKVLEVLDEVPWRQISTDSGTDEIKKMRWIMPCLWLPSMATVDMIWLCISSWPLVIQHSFWKWPFIVNFPIKDRDFI